MVKKRMLKLWRQLEEAHMSYAFQVQDGEVEEEKEAARKEEEQREMEEQSQGEKAMD